MDLWISNSNCYFKRCCSISRRPRALVRWRPPLPPPLPPRLGPGQRPPSTGRGTTPRQTSRTWRTCRSCSWSAPRSRWALWRGCPRNPSIYPSQGWTSVWRVSRRIRTGFCIVVLWEILNFAVTGIFYLTNGSSHDIQHKNVTLLVCCLPTDSLFYTVNVYTKYHVISIKGARHFREQTTTLYTHIGEAHSLQWVDNSAPGDALLSLS